jgi:hypothetical protein
MSVQEKYLTSRGVESAIKDAARKAYEADLSVSIQERIRQATFDRFLCRIFAEDDASEWVLKGGTGMLARVPSSRATRDVDLWHSGFTLEQALNDLRRLASLDLDDHFRFVYVDHSYTLAGDTQPYTDGYRAVFDTYIGVKKSTSVHVDLAIGIGLTGVVSVVPPANRLRLPRLATHDYRLYPIVDQIADKVCATMAIYSTGASSREKDLVDLVVIANTQNVDASSLRIAIASESRRRGLDPFDHFIIPSAWGRTYAQMTRSIPHCANYRGIDAAKVLVSQFLDPVLGSREFSGRWDHVTRVWR